MYAAILLGGDTLERYGKLTKAVLENKKASYLAKLKHCLVDCAGFDKDYAKWLSQNLHRLKGNSVKFLEDEGPNSESLVKFAIVTQFDSAQEQQAFRRCVNIFDKAF